MVPIFILTVLATIVAFVYVKKKKQNSKWKLPDSPFPTEWRKVLIEKINFYNALSAEERKQFEYEVQEFLLNHRITGISTSIDDVDMLLVASSAVIPIFGFPEWRYINLYEVLIYPSSFNEKFEVTGPDRRILGMVGTGYMDGKMILSKKALHHGFANESDKRNTAIHEFIHLIDKADGLIDGIPSLLMEKPYVIPWLDLMQKKIEEIYKLKSDINPYGGTSQIEFFAVVSEYFFERPKLLTKKHPELYYILEEVFEQKMIDRDLENGKTVIGRNSPCPCNSGVKFKKCCGGVHFS